jgi:hypothetical protein
MRVQISHLRLREVTIGKLGIGSSIKPFDIDADHLVLLVSNSTHHQAIGMSDVERSFRFVRLCHERFAVSMGLEPNGLRLNEIAAEQTPRHASPDNMLVACGQSSKT